MWSHSPTNDFKNIFFFGCQNVYILNNDEYPDLSQHGMLMAAYKHGQEYTDYILYVAFVSTVDTKFIYMYIGDETCPWKKYSSQSFEDKTN